MSITVSGGYQILDLKNIPIYAQADGVTVKPDSSIIGAIEQVGKKPFVVYNVCITSTDHSVEGTHPVVIPVYVVMEDDGTYAVELPDCTIVISPDTMYWRN